MAEQHTITFTMLLTVFNVRILIINVGNPVVSCFSQKMFGFVIIAHWPNEISFPPQ